jgi:pilus assembly protein Flp/PilA
MYILHFRQIQTKIYPEIGYVLAIFVYMGPQERHQGSRRMGRTISALLRDETGATAIEYGLIAALIAVAAVSVLTTVGSNLKATFSTVATKL